MKTLQFENTTKLFDKIKSISFFERLFSWKNITALSMDSYTEFRSVDKEINSLNDKCQELSTDIIKLKKDLEHLKEIKGTLQSENKILESKKEEFAEKNKENEKKIAAIEKVKEQKQEEYDHKVTELNSLKKQLDTDRIRIQEDREREIRENFERMKETWKNHETSVEQTMKVICNKYQVEFLDKEKVPFKGKPDNTLRICGECIIFDAKSPSSDDLTNFPSYLKSQAESVKKYIKEKDVKKDIFLVVPTNTLGVIKHFYYNMADYNVFIVSIDSLEPIILSLRKIEEYDFAEQLSPEDRDNICRVIGKFAHITKRRIQIDNFFSQEFINLLANCNNLPEDILKKAIEFEKSDKLNPPTQKRAKLIPNKDLKKETMKIKQLADIEEIDTKVDPKKIEQIPLYTETK